MTVLDMVDTWTSQYLYSNSTSVNDTLVPFDIEGVMGPRKEPLGTAIFMSLMYSVILIAGMVGNICTCIVIARNRYMHTATNYYLFSLAVSDLLFLVLGLPQEMYQLWKRYPYDFGEGFCVFRGWASESSTNASILTITAFTVERYLAICHPLRAHTMSRLSRAVKFIVVVWIIAGFVAIFFSYQFGIVYEVDSYGQEVLETAYCGVKRPLPHSFESATLVFFIFPGTLLLTLYVLIGLQLRRSEDVGRKHNGQVHVDNSAMKGKGLNALNRQNTRKNSTQSRKAVVKMLVAVVVAFFVCWAPFHAQRLMAVWITEPTAEDHKIFSIVTYISGIFYYISATINPILYSIMSLKFRHAFKDTLGKCCGRGLGIGDKKRHTNVYNSTLRSAAYDATDFTLVSESPQEDGGQSNVQKMAVVKTIIKQQKLKVLMPKERLKTPTRKSISNCSLQMMEEGAFDEVNITDFIDDGESQ